MASGEFPRCLVPLASALTQMMNTTARGGSKSELRDAVASCRAAFIGIGACSGVINLLMLTGSLYMLEVYDRILPSRSVPTLIGLSILTAVLFTFQALLEITRGRLLVRIGNQLDCRLGARVYDVVVRLPLRARAGGDGLQPMRVSTPSAPSSPAWVRPRCSTCPGFRSTSPSASPFTY